jgi:hypothetical protein
MGTSSECCCRQFSLGCTVFLLSTPTRDCAEATVVRLQPDLVTVRLPDGLHLDVFEEQIRIWPPSDPAGQVQWLECPCQQG